MIIFSRASAKAEHDLSSLAGVFLCVELGDPPDPSHISLEMAYPLGISWLQAQIWVHQLKLTLNDIPFQIDLFK